jgi:hypothetical protein
MTERAHSPRSWCKLRHTGNAQPDAEHMSELRRGGSLGPTHSPCGVRQAEQGRPVPTNGIG